MSEMMQPDSVFGFGKYRGKTVTEVFEIQPSYLCWMRKTGFSDFGKDVSEAIFAWEEEFPDEVKKVERSIAKSAARKAAEKAVVAASMAEVDDDSCDKIDGSFVPNAPVSRPASWGSW